MGTNEAEAAAARRMLDERELSMEYGISVKTAQRWRAERTGPAYVKVGRLVRYRPADVEAWLESRIIGGDQT